MSEAHTSSVEHPPEGLRIVLPTPAGGAVLTAPPGWELQEAGEGHVLVHLATGRPGVQVRPLEEGDDAEGVQLTLGEERRLPRLARALVADARLVELAEQRARAQQVLEAAEAGGRISPRRRAQAAEALRSAEHLSSVYRVERAMILDADGAVRPSASDFHTAYSTGALTPSYDPGIRLVHPPRIPLQPEEGPEPEQAATLNTQALSALHAGIPAPTGQFRSKSVFAGMTTAAALVLTGCGASSQDGERRCTDATGAIVDDDNCERDRVSGGGVFFYQYGGRTYRDSSGKTYVGGGSRTAPKGGFGGIGRSGGG